MGLEGKVVEEEVTRRGGLKIQLASIKSYRFLCYLSRRSNEAWKGERKEKAKTTHIIKLVKMPPMT